ncbi:MAG TPA: histidine--tRNA ligase [bacterium]|nr:histidine--tRNA ligase [bacterium]
MKQYKRVRGMHDIMPGETEKWQYAEKIISETVRLFNYRELRTPVIEEQSLFERSIGSESDIISKEMYTFQDKKGRNLALRPEGTASAVRAFIESGLFSAKNITRLCYYGPMFRYDRPQKGRYRQFYQFGVELLGGFSPFFDGEVIEILYSIINNLGIEGCYFGINTLGCRECREKYTGKIKEYLSSAREALCEDCKTRIENSPLRILDCKNDRCRELTKNIPSIKEVLCTECTIHFDSVLEYLGKKGIAHDVQTNLVRGLDYYTRTVFEVYIKGDNNAIAAGGRYDMLVRELGGEDIPAVGFAIGMERLLTLMDAKLPVLPAVYLVCMGAEARNACVDIAAGLRKEGIAAEMDYDDKSLKAALRTADRARIEWCVILGERELEKGIILFKNMVTGVQEEISSEGCIQRIKELIKC